MERWPRQQEHIDKAKALLEDHVDPVFWLNVQLVQLQYYSRAKDYDKSIALIDEVTPIVLNHMYLHLPHSLIIKHLLRLAKVISTELLKHAVI